MSTTDVKKRSEPSPLIIRVLGTAATAILLYQNGRYFREVWSSLQPQGAKLWLMIVSLIVVPFIWAIPLMGALSPAMALWERPPSVWKGFLLFVSTFVLGSLSQFTIALWGFAVLFLSSWLSRP